MWVDGTNPPRTGASAISRNATSTPTSAALRHRAREEQTDTARGDGAVSDDGSHSRRSSGGGYLLPVPRARAIAGRSGIACRSSAARRDGGRIGPQSAARARAQRSPRMTRNDGVSAHRDRAVCAPGVDRLQDAPVDDQRRSCEITSSARRRGHVAEVGARRRSALELAASCLRRRGDRLRDAGERLTARHRAPAGPVPTFALNGTGVPRPAMPCSGVRRHLEAGDAR